MALAASLLRARQLRFGGSICAAMARGGRPPSRAVLRPTRSLAWIAVVPS
jgi:hypothetical protein